MERYEENAVHIMVMGSRLNVSNNAGGQFEITNDKIIDSKDPSIFWSYPMGSMVATFKANTDATQAFDLHIEEADQIYEDIGIIHIFDGKEVEIQKDKKQIILSSDCNNKCIVKFVGTKEMKYYGVNIHFSIHNK